MYLALVFEELPADPLVLLHCAMAAPFRTRSGRWVDQARTPMHRATRSRGYRDHEARIRIALGTRQPRAAVAASMI